MARFITSLSLFLLAGASFLLAEEDFISRPRDLAEAHKSLAARLTRAEIERIKKMPSENDIMRIVGMPQTIGLTNEWQLNDDSALARYFKKMGVNDSHDMVGIVAATYWCKLHDRPFRLKSRIAELRKYYAREEAMKPDGRRSPRDGAEIDWFIGESSDTGTLYLGVSLSDGSFWRYDYRNRRGVEPARPDESKRLADSLRLEREMGVHRLK